MVGLDFPRSDTDFWNSYIKYVPQFGKQDGLDLKATNSENDIAKLTANVQTLIGQGVKGVVLAPQDTAAVAPTLAQLKQKKIPVVTVDTRPDSGNVYMVVRADNRAYGRRPVSSSARRSRARARSRCSRATSPRSTAGTVPTPSTSA